MENWLEILTLSNTFMLLYISFNHNRRINILLKYQEKLVHIAANSITSIEYLHSKLKSDKDE